MIWQLFCLRNSPESTAHILVDFASSAFSYSKKMIFSVSSAEVNWCLEFGPESVLLEVRTISTKTVLNSIELLLSVWNLLESQGIRFMEEALTGAPLTQDQLQRPYEVHKNLEVPGIHDRIRGWEGQ